MYCLPTQKQYHDTNKIWIYKSTLNSLLLNFLTTTHNLCFSIISCTLRILNKGAENEQDFVSQKISRVLQIREGRGVTRGSR